MENKKKNTQKKMFVLFELFQPVEKWSQSHRQRVYRRQCV